MRRGFAAIVISFALGALALAGCAPPADERTPVGGCDVAVQNAVKFSDAGTMDIIEARAFGPDCRRATLVLTLRDDGGAPLWAFATTFEALAGPRPPGASAEVAREEVERRLASWVNVIVSTMGELPAWPEGAEGLAANEAGLEATPLPRDLYELLRARNTPRLCYDVAPKAIECVARLEEDGAIARVYSAAAI